VSGLPEGTITLLFADVEGSTRHLLRLGDRYSSALERQTAVVSGAIERYRGYVVDTQGDSSLAAFVTAQDAIQAAIEAQRALAIEPWPDGEPFRVRFGVHTGEPVRNAAGYAGLDVHRAARICTAAHGGQILISQTTRDLIAHAVPADTVLLDLGHHLLKDLPHPEHLIQVAGPGLEREFPPPRTLGAPAGLPTHRQSLIGREDQLDISRDLILRDDIRLLSLTGPGGTGKTSLAIHLAGSLMPDFDDGVFFVPLAPINDPGLVPRAVARALGVQEMGSRPILDTLIDALGSRNSLLVLDNFEQVLPAASFLATLIQACPLMKVIVTSREVLHLSLEYEMPVPPLALPPSDSVTTDQLENNDAVRLFVARAREVRPAFELTDEIAPIVGEICRRLDGLPLALELAAARIRLLPPRALLARLDRRLPILTDGPRDLPARQRTLRDTIGWSYGLLDEHERQVFRALGAFVGGCSLEAAEGIVGAGLDAGAPDTLDLVASLIDKSLVRQAPTSTETRFTLLETIREFAVDRLEAASESDDVRRRHAEFFLTLVEQADPLLIGSDQVAWLDLLEAEHGNLVAALTWTRDAHAGGLETESGVPAAQAGLRLAGSLHWYWWLGGHVSEGRRWLAEVLSWEVGEEGQAARARALYAAGTLAMIQGAYDEAYDLLDEGVSLAEVLGDVVTQGRSQTYRGIVESYFYGIGRIGKEITDRSARHSLELLESTDDAWGQALAASQIGSHLRRDGHFALAEDTLRRACDLARTTGERYLIGSCLPKLGNVYVDQGDFAAAIPLYREALAAFRDLREVWWTGRCLQYLAVAAHGVDNHLLATLLLGSSDAVLESGGAQRIPPEQQRYLDLTERLEQELGSFMYADTYDRGHQMTLESILALVFDVPYGTGTR
jgi:predicted ATPase/class 3 adenylate cyclase